MKYFADGDQLVTTKDDFVDLQESTAVFYPLESEIAKTILEAGTVIALPLGDLRHIHNQLEMGSITTAEADGAMPPCIKTHA